MTPPPQARRALKALARIDPDLARIEREVGPLPWRTDSVGFGALLRTIVGQQISNTAAIAIWRRVCALDGCLSPEGFLAIDAEALRAAGLSRPKIAHGRALATAYAEGVLDDAAIAEMDDETAVARISSVRGLGRWTAEVYLLFALQRFDVFPAGDLALQAAAADLKGLEARPTPKVLRALAEPWQPYRAIAARLLWHWWRHVTGRPSTDDATQR